MAKVITKKNKTRITLDTNIEAAIVSLQASKNWTKKDLKKSFN